MSLNQQGVTLISVGLIAYKDIRELMVAQKDLVTLLVELMPKLVKMILTG